MFQVIVSGDEVAQAKPAPDMYVCSGDSSFALWMFYNFVIFDGLEFVPVYNFQIVDYYYVCMQ